LIEAALDQAIFGQIKEHTAGIAFFGTPHRGGNGVPLGKVVVNVLTALSGESKNTLLETLAKNSARLEDITQNFRSQLDAYDFVSFFETRKMQKSRGLFRFIKLVSRTDN